MSEQNKENKFDLDKQDNITKEQEEVKGQEEVNETEESVNCASIDEVDEVNDTENSNEETEIESEKTEESVEKTVMESMETEESVETKEEEPVVTTIGVEKESEKPKKESTGKKLSKKAKIGIAVAVAAVVGTGAVAFGGSAEDRSAKAIIKAVDELQEVNPYIQMMVGHDRYIYLLYNEKGEAFAESSSGGSAFYRNDNKIISIGTEEVYVDHDLNPLSFIKAAAKVAANNKDTGCAIKVEESTYTDEERGVEAKNKMYTVTVNGKENISKIYGTLEDEAYVQQSIEMLYSGFEDIDKSQVDVIVSVGETGRFGAICNVTYGTADEGNENVYTSWMFDGYIPTFDWEYPADLYKEVKTGEFASWADLAADITTDLANKMNTFMQENNMMVTDAVTSEVTGEQFLAMDENKQIETLKQVHADLYNYGLYVSCEENDMLKDIKDYYADEANKESVSLFQACINVGVGKGWLHTIEVDGVQENSTTENSQISEGATTEDSAVANE